ncbi:MAG TPA: TraR/DksA C4-type zinc finger protein [Chloroflexia bacterium]|nr:TraR/DksA C4-type zinc finger protein [Chloroflexia bacterium]
MVLRTRRTERTPDSAINTNVNHINQVGHMGGPKASHVKEVLLTLRTRLETQLEADDDRDVAMVRALQANIHSQLEQISEALSQIEQGKYGLCTNCLTRIESDRLVVRPYSTLCLGCQNRKERGLLAHTNLASSLTS